MSKARWIAAGFLGAFAASIVTVIYTGLMVEGSPAEFDVDSRFVTMTVGESLSIELFFDSPKPVAAARLEISLPDMLERKAGAGEEPQEKKVELVPGDNVVNAEVHAVAAGSGYLVARVFDEEQIALETVFVTVEPD